ncbi:M1 family metallopeptidase [Flagellimonas baculiformis]|uniref:M1 family metallopeptidase n=1 Tax=Flagellimonas baculiformis TaxID=3067310 RepID=UPI00296FDAFE|nr:M1 family metallopeptidase [Muricauda sp. D6]
MLSFHHKAFLLILIGHFCYSQNSLPIPTNFKKAFEKNARDNSGIPGNRYWQNSADYHIGVKFNPATRQLEGNVGIDYFNNSPDTLNKVIFKLFPNLYQAGAIRKILVSPGDVGPGVDIRTVRMDNRLVTQENIRIRGTNMSVGDTHILPGQKIRFEIAYAYVLNEKSFVRTGQVDPGAFVVAYFFPRIAVYDDIDGWDEYPYTGREEFYNDYGHFRAEITVPDHYQIWATGDLKNPDWVYEPKFVKRIQEASKGDEIMDIITASDLHEGNITQKHGWNTWIFEAEEVSDFAFAASDHYIWKASSVVVDPATKRRTRVDAVHDPDHSAYLPVANYARTAVSLISYQFPGIPFPYSHMTIFEGLDAMEYPMLVNNLPFEEGDAVMFTMHEIFHSIFPFYVGTNETKYSFMDEGWAPLTEFMLYPFFDVDHPLTYDMGEINDSAGIDQDVPIMTLTPQLYGNARFMDKDLKPALGFLYVKEMLGEDRFNAALKFYIEQWKGKHPTPYDFFNCFNKGAGVDLNWFWKNWFFEKNLPDLAIGRIKHHGSKYTVVIDKNEGAIVPVHLTILYQDDSKEKIKNDISCWAKGNTSITITFRSTKPIKKLILGLEYDVDIDRSNNVIDFEPH